MTVRVPEYDWVFNAVFNQEDFSLKIPNRQYVGPIDYSSVSWNVFVCVFDSGALSFSISESLYAKASVAWDRTSGKTTMSFKDDGIWGEGQVDGLIFAAFRYMIGGVPYGTLRYPMIRGNLTIVEK